MESYQKRYQDSISDHKSFWAEIAQRLDWMEPWASVRKFDFVNGQIEWFSGGKLNASYNCIDRHIKKGMEMKRLSFGKVMTQINLESSPIMIY